MNILKKNHILLTLLIVFIYINGCSSQYYYSGISEDKYETLLNEHANQKLDKNKVISLIGLPLVDTTESLWIYRSSKSKGNETFQKPIYNKYLKLYFINRVLDKIEEENI